MKDFAYVSIGVVLLVSAITLPIVAREASGSRGTSDGFKCTTVAVPQPGDTVARQQVCRKRA